MDWQRNQSGVDSIHKRKEATKEANQEGHFHIRKVDADWPMDIKGKHIVIGQE